MKSQRSPLLLGLILFTPAAASVPRRAVLAGKEKTELSGRSSGLDHLRAGQGEVAPARLQQEERTALSAAQAQSAELQDMRAGGVGVVIAIVVVVLLILLL